MTTVTVNRQKHVSFLADHSKDPVTKELIKVGDQVVVCAGCKTVYHRDVWVHSMGGKCCNQTQTLDDIPNREFTSLQKKKSVNNGRYNTNNGGGTRVKKEYYPGWMIFFLLAAIGSSIYAYTLNYNQNEKYEKLKRESEQQIIMLNANNNQKETDRTNLTDQNNNLRNQYNDLAVKFSNLATLISSIPLVAGARYEDRNNFEPGYGNLSEKVYFKVEYPILLKSLKVEAKGDGELRVGIYNVDGTKLTEGYNSEITSGEMSVVFNYVLPAGSYYLNHTGNTELLFDTAFNLYPVKSNGIVEITGNDVDDKYYMYYYDWQYSLQPEQTSN